MSAREEIMGRVRSAVAGRHVPAHPGPLEAQASDAVARVPSGATGAVASDPLDLFARRFEEAGGEVVRIAGKEQAREWLRSFLRDFAGAAVSPLLPAGLLAEGDVTVLSPEEAPLGISFAAGAAAASGTLLLDSREGRRLQLLPPTHLVLLDADTVSTTLGEALAARRGDLPSTLGLHSGPSRSADIGMVTVQGVHGPGRVIVLILEEKLPE